MDQNLNHPNHGADSFDVDAQTTRPRQVKLLSIIWRVALTLVILGGAGFAVLSMFNSKAEGPRRQPRERAFTVAVISPELGRFAPSIDAFGDVVAGREIDLRAEVSGEAVEVSANLVVGGEVQQGEQLVRIDDFSYQGAVRDAAAVLADANAQLAVNQEQLALEQINTDAAREQASFARRDLERAKALLASGAVTDKTVEDRELLVSQRDQAVAQRESALRLQQAGIERQKTTISRAEWTLTQAKRALENTVVTAPFTGIVTAATAAKPGRLISSGEVLAQLYEQAALDVRFTLSDKQYGELLGDGLIGRHVEAIWNIEPTPISVSGKITRVGAEVNPALGGIEIFARLADAKNLRPGTFVKLEIEGPAFENVLRLPETALYEDNHFYVVRDGRMARISAEIFARDGAHLLVRADITADDRIIATRVAQAGEGVKVTIEGEEEQSASPPTKTPPAAGEGDTPNAENATPQDRRNGQAGNRRQGAAGAGGGGQGRGAAPAVEGDN